MSGVTGAGLDQTEVLTQAEAILGVNASYCCEEKSEVRAKRTASSMGSEKQV